jgi:DNA-binding transcriptional LysR family regulator
MTHQVVHGLPASPALVPSAAPPPVPLEALLATTFDQLRTFSAVCRIGNVRAAARALGRDHSSIRKQLDTVEERFHDVADGRLLVHSANRGGPVHVTEVGRRVQEFADRTLGALEGAWHELHKARRQRPLRFGTSGFRAYVGEFLAQTHQPFTREFERRGMTFAREIVPVESDRGRHVLLERDDLDFAFAATMSRKAEQPLFDPALDFTEWSRDDLVVLANIDVGKAPLSSRLILERRIPMLAPHKGVIFELIVAELDEAERQQLNVVEWCDDGLVAMDVLHHRLRHAALFCTRTFARFAKSRSGSEHLHTVAYDCDWTHSFGLLARKTDLGAWSADHPARLLWQVTRRLAGNRRRTKAVSRSTGAVLRPRD